MCSLAKMMTRCLTFWILFRVLDGAVGKECGGVRVRLTLITTLPYVPGLHDGELKPHINETLLAITENSRSSEIERIIVIVDQCPEDVTLALRARLGTNKVSGVVWGSQPSYADLFRFADSLVGKLVVLANADVVLRRLSLLDPVAFYERRLVHVVSVRSPPEAFCSRKDAHRYQIVDRCVGWEKAGTSWDVYIFQAPLKTPKYELLEVLEPTPVFMNEYGAENRAGYFLAKSGYRLYNPCIHIPAEHWHCSPRTHKRYHYHADEDFLQYAKDHPDQPPKPGTRVTPSVRAASIPGLCVE